MRVALAQINPTVGDISGNCRKIVDFATRARALGAQLVVFPELAICGYPPKDLLLKPQFIADNQRALQIIASHVAGIDVIVGYAAKNDQPVGRPLYNAVAVLRDGNVASVHYKTLLPTYDVFDESRYFEPGPAGVRNQLVQIGDLPVGLSICEDLWNDERLIARRLYHQNPIEDLSTAGARLMINASASPFVVGKHDFRIQLFSAQAKRFGRPLVYVNQVGGNDELVFDGNSCVFDAQGNLIASAKDFEEDLLTVDLEYDKGAAARGAQRDTGVSEPGAPRDTGASECGAPRDTGVSERGAQRDTGASERGAQGDTGASEGGAQRDTGVSPVPGAQPRPDARISKYATGTESIYRALVLGLRDYLRKCGFKTAVLGLSGGIDSALTAAIAVAALGKDKVTGVAMPSRFSSEGSVNDARQLAENLGIEFHIVPIGDVHDSYERTLAPVFAGREQDVTEENLQARVRGAILMAISNKFNHLLLTTGNKSEIAVGYCTLYGDMCGGLAVISDVPKTTVWELSRWINQHEGRELIPRSSIEKVPSAELRPNQTDQDSLPPYDVLDAIMHSYVEEDKGAAEIVGLGFDPQTVLRVIKLIDRSEYKRRQAAPGLKVTSRAFGFGRRMPIAQSYTQVLPRHGEPSPVLE